jgi:VIT1/CCC1 family predicted Fe2+/Mn2+ transporter
MSGRIFNRRQAFAAVLGLTDGILNSLTLAAGRLIQPQNGLSLSLMLRVGAASALAGGVVFFTAEVAQRNYELVRAGRQLNLASHGRLATTRLGHFVLMETSGATLTVIGSNFAGAIAPLLVGLTMRAYPWTPIAFAVLLLGVLGILIAHVTYRSRAWWGGGLMVAGAGLSGLGIWLHIV